MSQEVESGEREAGPRPDWADAASARVVDVRDELRRGGEPFQKIMAAAMEVGPDGVLMVRAIFEPGPLYGVLGAKGFEAWAEQAAEEDWKVYFHRKTEGGGHRCRCGGHG